MCHYGTRKNVFYPYQRTVFNSREEVTTIIIYGRLGVRSNDKGVRSNDKDYGLRQDIVCSCEVRN
jgi:hypothetical protein